MRHLQLDRDRGNYGLQEAKLCERLISAAGVDRKSKEAAAVLSWKKGSKSAGAGDLAFVLQQVCLRALRVVCHAACTPHFCGCPLYRQVCGETAAAGAV